MEFPHERPTTNQTLHLQPRRLKLSQALEDWARLASADAASGVGLLYTPYRCRLVLWRNGHLRDEAGSPHDLSCVFEARVFNPTAELRWLNNPSPAQQHRMVILCEQDHAAALLDWARRDIDCRSTLDSFYLLWGEGTGHSPGEGWSELATARIGALSVPLGGIAANQRVRLCSREYLVESEHGNVIVLDERLLNLSGVAHA